MLLVYVGLGLTIGATSGLGAPWTVADWWDEPIVWQKAVIWLVLLEVIAFGGAWGPLWAGMLERVGDPSERLPRRRIGQPAQLDSTLLYLVDPASECVTGTIVKVDDGQMPR